MARKHRIWYPGAIYHITARGNRRSQIFNAKEDYLTYLRLLENTRIMYPFTLHSYCLMTNHLHLLLETSDLHIKFIMKEIHFRYAIYFNKRYGYEGHVFQGRYGAKLIDSHRYFLDASRYIHRNPLEANMVADLEGYEWSSFPAYTNLIKNPLVCHSKTLNYFPKPKHINYKQFVERSKE